MVRFNVERKFEKCKTEDKMYVNTGYTQKNGAVSKVNKKFISHLTSASVV